MKHRTNLRRRLWGFLPNKLNGGSFIHKQKKQQAENPPAV
jgi:hypothetical protein